MPRRRRTFNSQRNPTGKCGCYAPVMQVQWICPRDASEFIGLAMNQPCDVTSVFSTSMWQVSVNGGPLTVPVNVVVDGGGYIQIEQLGQLALLDTVRVVYDGTGAIFQPGGGPYLQAFDLTTQVRQP